MALSTKVIYRIAKLQTELRAIKATTRDSAHREALDTITEELEQIADKAAELLADTRGQAEGQRTAYPFGSTEVGAFFEVGGDRSASLRASASAYAKRNGGKYKVRSQPDGTVRCYRVA